MTLSLPPRPYEPRTASVNMSELPSTNQDIPIDAAIVRSSDQVSCDLAGEVVVLSLRNGAYYGLDPVAARIWELLAERRTVTKLCDMLVGEYDGVEAERCREDVRAFLQDLKRWDLIDVELPKNA